MTKNRNVSDLGIYVSMLILNNKIFERGLITEPMKNKMSALIQSGMRKGKGNFGSFICCAVICWAGIMKTYTKSRPPKEVWI